MGPNKAPSLDAIDFELDAIIYASIEPTEEECETLLDENLSYIADEEKTSELDTPSTDNVYEFQAGEIQQAKQAYQQGKKIRYHLSRNLSAKQLIDNAQELGIDTTKLYKALTSGAVLKKLVDDAVSAMQNKDIAEHKEEAVPYLKYVTEVKALECV